MLRGTLALAASALIALAGCGTTSDSSDPATRPGSPAVWARIENGTDCAALQSEFDTAMDNAEAFSCSPRTCRTMNGGSCMPSF
jgi:hypothetical protein